MFFYFVSPWKDCFSGILHAVPPALSYDLNSIPLAWGWEDFKQVFYRYVL